MELFTQIYPNTEHDRIETLWPLGRPSLPLTTLLNTKQHIEAHSVTWRSADSESLEWLEKLQERENLTKLLASQLAKDTKNTQRLSTLIWNITFQIRIEKMANPKMQTPRGFMVL